MAARAFKYQPRGVDRRKDMLRLPRESELPADPIQRFKLRQEVIRRAECLMWNQLYHMEHELEAVARACRGPQYRRRLLVDMLSHYAHESMECNARRRVAAKAREVVAALEAPALVSPTPPEEGLRLLRGGRA